MVIQYTKRYILRGAVSSAILGLGVFLGGAVGGATSGLGAVLGSAIVCAIAYHYATSKYILISYICME